MNEDEEDKKLSIDEIREMMGEIIGELQEEMKMPIINYITFSIIEDRMSNYLTYYPHIHLVSRLDIGRTETVKKNRGQLKDAIRTMIWSTNNTVCNIVREEIIKKEIKKIKTRDLSDVGRILLYQALHDCEKEIVKKEKEMKDLEQQLYEATI